MFDGNNIVMYQFIFPHNFDFFLYIYNRYILRDNIKEINIKTEIKKIKYKIRIYKYRCCNNDQKLNN